MENSSQDRPQLYALPARDTTSIAAARSEARGRRPDQILLYYSPAPDYPLAGIPNPSAIKTNFFTLEETMRVSVTLLSLALTAAVFSTMPAGARQAAADQSTT